MHCVGGYSLSYNMWALAVCSLRCRMIFIRFLCGWDTNIEVERNAYYTIADPLAIAVNYVLVRVFS